MVMVWIIRSAELESDSYVITNRDEVLRGDFNITNTVRNYNFYYTTEFVLCLFVIYGNSVAMLS